MTRIEVFFNVVDKPAKVVELSEKALAKGRRLLIYGSDQAAVAAVERSLWTRSQLSFLPNCWSGNPLAAETPIVLDCDGTLVHDDVLVNLHAQQPLFFSRFRRLIEIVGLDEADKVQARERYRFYRDRGYDIRTFDANGAAL